MELTTLPKSQTTVFQLVFRCFLPCAIAAIFASSAYAFDTSNGEFLNRLYWTDFEEIRIEQAAGLGITEDCGGMSFCPNTPMPR